MRRATSTALLAVLLLSAVAVAAEPVETPAERGFRTMRSHPFIPPDFDDEVFAALWKTWPEPLRSQAKQAGPAERRRMAFSRYGLMEPPGGDGTGPALGYLDDGQGGWVMNCLACHGGKVAGQVIPGLPNSHIALQTLTEEVRLTKLKLGKQLSHMDLGSLKIPISATNGTTNSVVFGIAFGVLRNADMTVNLSRPVPEFLHHDMDAPPFWNVKKKQSLYIDGFAPKTHRPLMQFMLLPSNNAQTVKGWEEEFRDILAWIESTEPPAWPWPIDGALAAKGETVFNKYCARCHGTYGENGRYEQAIVPIDEIGTDPLRLQALTPEHRRWVAEGWMSRFGRDPVVVDPGGYIAPPLDGVWASAPYFHNGSVPTLWHVLHPAERPTVWKRTEDGYDRERAGLEIGEFDAVPPGVRQAAERRTYFDTRLRGKKAGGHTFPDALSEDEKRSVLEYLKTL